MSFQFKTKVYANLLAINNRVFPLILSFIVGFWNWRLFFHRVRLLAELKEVKKQAALRDDKEKKNWKLKTISYNIKIDLPKTIKLSIFIDVLTNLVVHFFFFSSCLESAIVINFLFFFFFTQIFYCKFCLLLLHSNILL